MTKVEFDDKCRDLKNQKMQAMSQFLIMNKELKEEIAIKKRQIHELSQQVEKLKAQKSILAERQIKVGKEWNDKIHKFIHDFNTQWERSWDDISTYTIVKQLRKRGWGGEYCQ